MRFFILLLLPFVVSCSLSSLRNGIHKAKLLIMNEQEQEPPPEERNGPRPSVCCWCQSPPEWTNVLFPFVSPTDCAEKNNQNYRNCIKVTMLEGNCNLVKMGGHGNCASETRIAMNEGVKVEIKPPPNEFSACDSETKGMIKDFEVSGARANEMEEQAAYEARRAQKMKDQEKAQKP